MRFIKSFRIVQWSRVQRTTVFGRPVTYRGNLVREFAYWGIRASFREGAFVGVNIHERCLVVRPVPFVILWVAAPGGSHL